MTEALAVYRMPVLDASLAQRMAFAESAGPVCAVSGLDSTSAASLEVLELTKEILAV